MKFWLKPSQKITFEHARRLTAYYAKSFYFSARLLPQEKRWATYGLYGFCRYADNLIDNPRDRRPSELLEEIEYLSKELEIAYRSGESEHPIIGPFITVAKKFNIPIEYPQDLLRGVKMDIEIDRYQTFKDLYVFCYRVAGVVGLMMTHVLGHEDPRALVYAEKLGIAMQLTNILRDIQEDNEMGRMYLPLEELKQFGLNEDDIKAGKMSDKMLKMMQFQVRRAHHYYEAAKNGIPMLEKNSQFAIYAASKIYRGILYKLEARHYNPFQGRVFVSKFSKLEILAKEVFKTRVLRLFKTPIATDYKMAKEQ